MTPVLGIHPPIISSDPPRGPAPKTITAALVERLLATAAEGGVDAIELCRSAALLGGESEQLGDYVELDRYYRLWELALGRCTRRELPLLVAEGCRVDTLRLVGYACATAATLGDAQRNLARFMALCVSGEIYDYDEREEPRLVLRQPHGAVSGAAWAAEMALARAVRDARAMTGLRVVPREVAFVHAAPVDVAPFESFFGCAVRWSSGANEIVWSAEAARTPLIKADPGFNAYFVEQAEALLSHLPAMEDVVDRVRRAVSEGLEKGDASLPTIAKRLGCSPRTLRRRLSSRGTNFRAVIDEVRCELAMRYLQRSDISLTELAFMLGFSEPSNFHRAFKRWTSETPSTYRSIGGN